MSLPSYFPSLHCFFQIKVWNKACYFCWLTCVSGLRSYCIVTDFSLLLLSRVCFCCRLSRFLATCWPREVRRGSHSDPRLAGSYVFLSGSVAGDRILITLLWRILWIVAQITTQIKTRNNTKTSECLFCVRWRWKVHPKIIYMSFQTHFCCEKWKVMFSTIFSCSFSYNENI